jgi:hypothetical protein
MIMVDIPQYIIRPSMQRILIPQIIITTVLAFVFYVGIAINVALLRISIPGSVRWLIIAILALLVIIQGLLSYVQTAKVQYAVYSNRIQIEGPKPVYLMFNAVQDVQEKRNFFDNIFHTGTLILEPGMKLAAIPNFEQMSAYIKQMMQYSRTQYVQQ